MRGSFSLCRYIRRPACQKRIRTNSLRHAPPFPFIPIGARHWLLPVERFK
jgi:hypothetical protein